LLVYSDTGWLYLDTKDVWCKMKDNSIRGYALNVDLSAVLNKLESLGAVKHKCFLYKKGKHYDDKDLDTNNTFYDPEVILEYFQITFSLDGVEIVLQKWPKIPPLLSVEDESYNSIMEMLTKLGVRHELYTEIDADFLYGVKYGINLYKEGTLRFNNDELQMISVYLEGDEIKKNAESYLAV